MKINADFAKFATVHTITQEWIASPMPGVDRKPLDRFGAEVARATSIVRYAPQSHFSPHTHSGGEEFVVLDGVFQDENGDYPIGSYVRNPPQSEHKPGSQKGCVIFVKLWQFQPNDRQHVNIQMDKAEITCADNQNNVVERLLFADQHEQVKHITLSKNTQWQSDATNGNEILVLDGSVLHNQIQLNKHDWLRVPIGQKLLLQALSEGAKIWIKTGNLPDIDNQINRVERAK
ncbi:MAG: anti-sigma factor ChrR (cupin superfamily) [Gammaproteobacteria bacterium]|jgi:anti-sigma factor ChrR (cupin superfamily)